MNNPECVAQIIDVDGVIWEFEGHIQGNPIWCKKGEARPMVFSENEAWDIAKDNARANETPSIRIL